MGNALEYAICQGLQKRKISPANDDTTQKLKRLKRDFDQVNEPSRVKYRKLDAVLDRLGVNTMRYPQYELTLHDHANNPSRDTTDVVLKDPARPDDALKLSIKNNNTYVKHQRPNKLYMQLDLGSRDADRFKAQYRAINDRYYNMWKHLKTWDKVPTTQKFRMYEEVNQLTLRWIGYSPSRLTKYLSFVLDVSDPQKYILKWAPSANDFVVIRYDPCDFSVKGANKAKLLMRDSSFIEIHMAGGVVIALRIHNASSRITETLSLKYCTTVVAAS